MRALQITAIGEPSDVLKLVESEDPTPRPGQVLVAVDAATINASDFLYISGQYFATPTPPEIAGAEGVGRVLSVGSGVDPALIGASVLLLPTYRHGTWATHVIAETADVVVVPSDIDTNQLAMVGINPMTAMLMLRNFGDPARPGRWIGQTAGNSAVGEYVVKLARRLGWKTLSVVRREEAAELVRGFGGDRVVIDDVDLESSLAHALGDAELDLVIDSIGGPTTRQLAHHLRFGGTLVSYAWLSGQTDSVDILDLVGKQVSWTGFWEINWLRRSEPAAVQAGYRDVVELVADGTISTRIDRTMNLDSWTEAIALAQRTGGRQGKVLFTFDR